MMSVFFQNKKKAAEAALKGLVVVYAAFAVDALRLARTAFSTRV